MPENSADTGLSLPEWNYQYIKSGDAQYDYNRAEQYVPMWYTNVIYNECCCFVQDGDSITAKLKFKPKRIISVRDWSLEKEYTEGVDYTFDAEQEDAVVNFAVGPNTIEGNPTTEQVDE